jgi:hypothetical protein
MASATKPDVSDDRATISVRLSREQLKRVKQFALDEETTIQDLAVRGLSELLKQKGRRAL